MRGAITSFVRPSLAAKDDTGTTVLTFLAVFLIQNSQNRDGAAIQAKLDEILRSVAHA